MPWVPHSSLNFFQIQKADDLGLPPRTVIVRNDYFSPEEKELYLSLFSDAKRKFNNYVDSGTILNSEQLSSCSIPENTDIRCRLLKYF